MMTPEQKFARWVRVSIAAFLGIFAWFIVADIWIPLTPDSTVMRVVTPVSSRVSGYVSHVYVHNNSQVKKGDLLYELDPTPFINKVEAAQIALEQAKLSNQQLDAQIAAARANLRTAQYTARNDKVTLDRYQRLSTMQNVSQSDLDKVRTTWQTSEQSVSALNAQIQNLLIQRGERDDKRNVTLQKYRNALEEAQLNLAWTKVRAETDGMVSNLQLNPGIYATAATAVLALVNNNTDIVADFREKSLRHTAVNTDAAVVFDALPGQVVLSVPHFLFMLETLRNSDLVAVLPERLVRGQSGLVVVEPPLAVAGFEMLMLWHERWHRDPAHQWLRQFIVNSLEEQTC
ncbi:biotin/lipoyl-binding protein [Klebsiella pneumoniae]|uniref:biotin/lipoyl-binding protein n=1 Tax=Klebsiella pneumoniae TaxID=573 RepID=UPI003EE1FCB2